MMVMHNVIVGNILIWNKFSLFSLLRHSSINIRV